LGGFELIDEGLDGGVPFAPSSDVRLGAHFGRRLIHLFVLGDAAVLCPNSQKIFEALLVGVASSVIDVPQTRGFQGLSPAASEAVSNSRAAYCGQGFELLLREGV
jgi:hypothetical protein